MTYEHYRKLIADLLANHRSEEKALVNVMSDEYTDFIKKVASNDTYSLHVYFDINGRPLEGFLMDDTKDDESYDIEIGDKLISSLRLSQEEMQQAIAEYNNK